MKLCPCFLLVPDGPANWHAANHYSAANHDL
jgi:hypothetical protein